MHSTHDGPCLSMAQPSLNLSSLVLRAVRIVAALFSPSPIIDTCMGAEYRQHVIQNLRGPGLGLTCGRLLKTLSLAWKGTCLQMLRPVTAWQPI